MRRFMKSCSAILITLLMIAITGITARCEELTLAEPGSVEAAEVLCEEPDTEPVGAGQCIRGYVTGYAHYEVASAYLAKLNEYRRSCGVGSLQIDQELSDFAMQRAAEQLCLYGHTRPDGSGWAVRDLFDGAWGGETAMYSGTVPSADTIFKSFHSSSAHDAISRDAVYKYVGIGIVESKEGYVGIVCNYRSCGTPAPVKTEKESKKWSINVSPDYFVPEISPAKVSADGGKKLLTVRGKCYNLKLTKSTYAVSNGISRITSGNSFIADIENGVIFPRSAGTAELTISACGKTYTVNVEVEGQTQPEAETTPTPMPPEQEKEEKPLKTYDGTYTIHSAKNSNYVIDVAGASKMKGANIQLYRENSTEAQVFIIKSAGNGYYTITNRRSGMMVDVSGGSKKSGTNIHQYTPNGTSAQLWRIQENSDGTVTFVSKLGTVLDVHGGLMQNNRNIWTYTANGTIAQKWVLQKI